MRIEDGVNLTLDTLTVVRGVLESVRDAVISIKGDTVTIRTTDLPRVLEALASLNKTLVKHVTVEIEGVKVVVTEGFKALSDSLNYTIALVTEQGAVVAESLADLERMLATLGDNITVVKLSLDRIATNLSRISTVTMRIEDGVNLTLDTLTVVRGVLESVRDAVISIKGDTVTIRTTDLPRVLEALASLNKTLVKHVTVEIEGVKVVVTEGFKALSDSIASSTLAVVSRVEAVQLSLTRLTEMSTTMRGLAESMSRDLVTVRGAIENLGVWILGLEDMIGTVESKIDIVTGRLANLSEKRDVTEARVALVEEVRGAQTTLVEELRVLREDITTSTRNWILLNTALVLLAIALIAYTLLLARRRALTSSPP
jgi:predicted transcriptional regulator